MWLMPLWLMVALPALDAFMVTRTRRMIVLAALAVSAFSAAFPGLDPWVHPWLYAGS